MDMSAWRSLPTQQVGNINGACFLAFAFTTESHDNWQSGLHIQFAVDPFPSERELSVLWQAAWGSPVSATYRRVLSRSLCHLGAYDSSLLVGLVNVAWDGGIHAFILDTCVHPDHRRQGVATALVTRAADLARERGARWLHVDFEPHLSEFDRKCGFRSTDTGLLRL